MADLDGDGHRDLLSGSWPGEIFLFRGKGKGEFGAKEKLRHPDGKAVHPGGGFREDGGDWFSVAGDATFEERDGKQGILYEGEWREIPKGKRGGITGIASAVQAVDWDGDGDLDLLIGDIRGAVHYVRNEGTAKAWKFAKPVPLEGASGAIRVEGDAGPFVADWDGDGKADLLVGAGDGSVQLFRNGGAGNPPVLESARTLVPPGHREWGEKAPRAPTRGSRAKVCAADWNGDGRLDLLLGDVSDMRPDLPEPGAEEKAEHARLRTELEKVQEEYARLEEAASAARAAGKEEEAAKLDKETGEVGRRWGEIQGKLPRESETHGWVWLFLRKPAAKETGMR